MKLFKFLIYTVLILQASFYLTSCFNSSKKSQNVVATYGDDYAITLDELKEYVYDWYYDKKYRDHAQAFRVALDLMVTNQIKRLDFFDIELDKDEALLKSIRRTINEELVTEYYTEKYVKKYVNEDFAEMVYEIMDKQVHFQEVVLQLPENVSEKQVEAVQSIALDIKTEIDNGKDIKEIPGLYSQNSTFSIKGSEKFIGWQQAAANPSDSIIFTLNSDDVRVLYSYDSFYIVKVEDIKKIELEPFESIKDEILSKIKNAYYGKFYNKYEADKEKLIDESSLQWNEKSLEKLRKWSEIPRFYRKEYKQTLQEAIEENNFLILTYSGGSIDLKEYLRLLDDVLIPQTPADEIRVEDLKTFILEAIRTDEIVKKAEALGLRKNIFHYGTKNSVLKNQIAYLYNVKVIDSQIPEPTTEMLQEFYDQQKDSLYYQLNKINIYAMIYSDEQKANDVMHVITNGTPFEKISGRWFVKTFLRNRNGGIESYLSQEPPYLANAAFNLDLNETAGPVKYEDPEKGEQFAVIKCVNIQPEKQLLYDDVKESIAEDYFKYHKEKRMRKVNKQLWKKYNVKIFEDVITSKFESN